MLTTTLSMSERLACKAVGLARSTYRRLPVAQTSARLIDLVNAPATPVPLHPGAARYYRERDLFR